MSRARTWASLPTVSLLVDAAATQGPLETWRHTVGQGGFSPQPLPGRVVAGLEALEPRLIRVFLQEYFGVYPDHGRFDWGRLDPFMDALARTGANVVAAITLKPPALFPTLDQTIWQPTDPAAWQRVLFELVRRYSVERPLVTHWEVANEPDIGERGGAPYLIPDPAAYAEFYRLSVAPILDAFPGARIGGPVVTGMDRRLLPAFVEECRRSGTRLDFVSWHVYSDDPHEHAAAVTRARALVADFPGGPPELMVTEWNKGFDWEPAAQAAMAELAAGGAPPVAFPRLVSVAEMAHDPRRAAIVAASILDTIDAGPAWTFYYHAWDHSFDPEPLRSFLSADGIALPQRYWNEAPLRFGLFDETGEVRPQYFVYQMLGRLGDERLMAQSDDPRLRVLAARNERGVAALVVRLGDNDQPAAIAEVEFANPAPGPKRLTVYRIDGDRRWDAASLELLPVEAREVYATTSFRCQVSMPGDGVVMVRLDDRVDGLS